MTEQEQIKKLQEELREMNEQVKAMQKHIHQMYDRVTILAPDNRHKAFSPTANKNKGRSAVLENYIGLNLIHFVGIIVLVIGLSIGVKYAIDRNLISEAMRIILAYCAGILLFLVSVRVKKNYLVFSAILLSGGMASLYFTTYAAYVYYSMFSFAVAFCVMMLLTFYTVFEALRYNRFEIALLGLAGAYGIPFLISHNTDRPDLFFMYIAVINVAIVFLYVKKEWKIVGRVASLVTWLLFLGWCSARFRAGLEATAVFFLFFFYLMFQGMEVSLKLFKSKSLTETDTNYILFNNILLYLAAVVLCKETRVNVLTTITGSMALLTALESMLARYVWPSEQKLKKILTNLAFLFFVVFIAQEWKGFTVTLLWLLTSILLFIAGAFIKSATFRIASVILMALTLFKLVVFDSLTFTAIEKVISYVSLGILLLLVSFFYQKFRDQLFGNKE